MLGKDKPPSRSDRWGRWFAIALVGGFAAHQDFEVARTWYRQIRATGFTTTEGVVREHRAVPVESKNRRLRVVYEYDAGGTRRTADRVWYDGPRPSYAHDELVAARFPPGSHVTVWYDPADPTAAVLLPGLQGLDVLSLWYLLPLNYFAFMFRPRAGSILDDYDPARQVREQPWGWRFDPADHDRWDGYLLALVVSLAGWYVVNLLGLKFLPSVWEAVGMTAGAVATAGLLVYAFRAIGSVEWLEVDTTKRELRWHSGGRWAAPLHLPFEAVTDVRVGEVGDADPVYRPEVEWYTTRHRTRTITLPISFDRAAVEAFVARLRAAVRNENPV